MCFVKQFLGLCEISRNQEPAPQIAFRMLPFAGMNMLFSLVALEGTNHHWIYLFGGGLKQMEGWEAAAGVLQDMASVGSAFPTRSPSSALSHPIFGGGFPC